MPHIVRATKPHHWIQARRLIERYAAELEFDLDFQDFENEIESLPRQYGAPLGCLLLACVEDEPMGCVALRSMGEEVCEMKRLYVCSQGRGTGLGKNLAEELVRIARDLGYRSMRLDTVPSMRSARSLYASMGFRIIAPYRYNPVVGAQYLELDLSADRGYRDTL